MRKTSIIRRVIPIVAVIVLALSVASCTSATKYGCPNHLSAK
jgi:hypothetical protein